MSAAIDLLIEPSWIIPIEPAGAVLAGHALAVDQGRIVALLPVADANSRYAPREHLRLPGKVLLPGFVNLHTHAAMTLLRGYADDLPLMRWLNEHIWPAEAKHLSSQFVRDGTLLAAWEMLRGGNLLARGAKSAAYGAGLGAAYGAGEGVDLGAGDAVEPIEGERPNPAHGYAGRPLTWAHSPPRTPKRSSSQRQPAA